MGDVFSMGLFLGKAPTPPILINGGDDMGPLFFMEGCEKTLLTLANGIIFHQPIDFHEIYGDFPEPKRYILGEIGRVRSPLQLTDL